MLKTSSNRILHHLSRHESMRVMVQSQGVLCHGFVQIDLDNSSCIIRQ